MLGFVPLPHKRQFSGKYHQTLSRGVSVPRPNIIYSQTIGGARRPRGTIWMVLLDYLKCIQQEKPLKLTPMGIRPGVETTPDGQKRTKQAGWGTQPLHGQDRI